MLFENLGCQSLGSFQVDIYCFSVVIIWFQVLSLGMFYCQKGSHDVLRAHRLVIQFRIFGQVPNLLIEVGQESEKCDLNKILQHGLVYKFRPFSFVKLKVVANVSNHVMVSTI